MRKSHFQLFAWISFFLLSCASDGFYVEHHRQAIPKTQKKIEMNASDAEGAIGYRLGLPDFCKFSFIDAKTGGIECRVTPEGREYPINFAKEVGDFFSEKAKCKYSASDISCSLFDGTTWEMSLQKIKLEMVFERLPRLFEVLSAAYDIRLQSSSKDLTLKVADFYLTIYLQSVKKGEDGKIANLTAEFMKNFADVKMSSGETDKLKIAVRDNLTAMYENRIKGRLTLEKWLKYSFNIKNAIPKKKIEKLIEQVTFDDCFDFFNAIDDSVTDAQLFAAVGISSLKE